MPIATRAFAATASDAPLSPYSFERRDPGPDDVAIAIKFAGICHSDVHIVHNDLGNTRYPIVPGHEVVGTVEATGEGVSGFSAGDRVGMPWLAARPITSSRRASGQPKVEKAGVMEVL